jgi:hypothetical protein
LPNGRLSDNAALIASINGPSFGGFASISTLTASLRSATLHTGQTLFKRRLFAVVLCESEKVARLRRAGERHEIDLRPQ